MRIADSLKLEIILGVITGFPEVRPIIISAFIDVNIVTKDINICSVPNKKSVAEIVGIKDYNTLNNYVKKFKDKKAIRKDGRNYLLSKLLDLGTKSVKININWTDER